jgi:hypothetical protein
MSRHTLPGLALLAAGAAMIASQFCWPRGSDSDDVATMLGAAASHPVAWTLANALEALAAVLGVAGSLGLLARLRGRGRRLAGLASAGLLLGCVAASSSAAGNIVVLAMAQQLPVAQATTAYQGFISQPYLIGVFPMFYLGMIGWLLLVVAAARGHLVSSWIIIVEVIGLVLVGTLDNGLDAPYNALLFVPQLVAVTIVSISLMRAPQQAEGIRSGAATTVLPQSMVIPAPEGRVA